MLRIPKLFVDLCLLRANPQDLPLSVALELITLATYTALSYVLALSSTTPGTALLAALVDVGMLVGLAYAGLWILDLKNRLTKLITALAGSGTIWQLVALPVMSLLIGSSDKTPDSTLAAFGYLLLLALVAWAIFIIGHILRHALNMKFFFALGVALLYVYTSMRVGSALFIAAQ
ncbi:MAG: hypothetical protein HY273_11560 [Gammaproteobacteria bacterium]|nr:hypothetical protein [Gammaproteobacteria bacterium]